MPELHDTEDSLRRATSRALAVPAHVLSTILESGTMDVLPALLGRRLRVWGGLWAAIGALSLSLQFLLRDRMRSAMPAGLLYEPGTFSVGIPVMSGLLLALSLAIYFYAGRETASAGRLRAAAAAHLLLVSALVAGIEAIHLPPGQTPWGVSWVLVLVILYPVVLPCRGRHTLIATGLAAATSPLAVVLAEAKGGLEVHPDAYLSLVAHSVVAVLLSLIGGQVVHRLGQAAGRGMELGAYRLEEEIGAGGMGSVWRARHRLLVRPAAVKIVRPQDLAVSAAELERTRLRFEREAQATASLESPHTVRLFDFGATQEGSFYYAMELLVGIDLDRWVSTHGAMNAARAVHVLRQASHSLKEAHALGLVHRDVKPANVMLCRVGPDYDFVKVCDFGLVKWQEGQEGLQELNLTMDGAVPGTPGFIAPECIGGAVVDARSDVYALGCVAHLLLSGQSVFEGRTALEVTVRHATEAPTPLRQVAEVPVPEALEALVLACLSKDPEHRPADAGELERQLRTIEASLPRPWTQEDAARWWQLHLPELATIPLERVRAASLRPPSDRPAAEGPASCESVAPETMPRLGHTASSRR